MAEMRSQDKKKLIKKIETAADKDKCQAK